MPEPASSVSPSKKFCFNCFSVKKEDAVKIELEKEPLLSSNSTTENQIHICDAECKKKFPLHRAASKCQYDEFKTILESGSVDLMERDCKGYTVLMNLCQATNPEDEVDDSDEKMVELFLKYISENKQLNKEKVIEILNAKSDEDGNTALHYVAEKRNVNVVKLLLQNGSDASCQNKNGSTPLHLLTERKSEEAYLCTELLLDAMPNKDILDNNDFSVLHITIGNFSNASPKMIQLMLNKGCSTSLNKTDEETGEKTTISILQTAIMWVYQPDEESCKSLTEFVRKLSKKEINYKNDYGNTALHLAAYWLEVNIMKSLFSHPKIDILLKNNDEETALHRVAVRGWNKESDESVKILMTNGGNIDTNIRLFNEEDKNGQTAFKIAIEKDSVRLSRAILYSHPDTSLRWMDETTFRDIYKKVPEIFLPALERSINYDGKTYEANHEKFSANIEALIGKDNNVYDTDNDKYPEVLKKESDNLDILLKSEFVGKDERDNFLSDPIVSLFIIEKWKKLRMLYWCGMSFKVLWLISYIAFTINVVWYTFPYENTFLNVTKIEDQNDVQNHTVDYQVFEEDSKQLDRSQIFIGCFLIVFSLIRFACRIILSVTTVGWKDTSTKHFWVHLLFTLYVCVILVFMCFSGIQDWIYQAVPISVIWIAFILLWDLREVPVIGVYVDVFFIVMKNLSLILLSFSPLVIGFSIALSMLLGQHESFLKLHWNVIKLLVMMLGEINFDEINNDDYVTPSHTLVVVMLALFVITIPIAMFNLLLGFTVSDVRTLQAEGELKVRISTLKLIIRLELLVLSDLAQKLFSTKFLWRYLMEPKPGDECGYQLNIRMDEIPPEIREKIRKLARENEMKKPNQK